MPPKKTIYSALPKKVFVTGGSGFIGSHVVQRLHEEGCEVKCLILPHDAAPALVGIPHQRIDGDLSNATLLQKHMEGCGLVIHLAAIYAIWLERPALMFEVNVQGTRNIMRAARKAGVKRVVHTSSIAAVGVRAGQEPSDETTAFNDWNNPDPYVLSKYISELEALAANGDDLEVVAVNPAFPFGENDLAPTPTGSMIVNAMTGKMPFLVHGGFNAVYVSDVAEGHLLAAVNGRPGERYLLSGHNVSYVEFGGKLAELLGRRPPKMRIPTKAAKTLGWMAEKFADHVTHKQPLATYRSISYTVGRHLYFSSKKAEEELGYKVSPLNVAMKKSVDWFRTRLDEY
jgi:dihydroflavonol-4-reductase